eukprot:3148241-Karenia_brevis.AAC.1
MQCRRSNNSSSTGFFQITTSWNAQDILRGHKVVTDRPGNPDPTLMDIKSILRHTPQTAFVTISRRGTALLNRLCLEAQYGDQRPVMTIPGDYETNMNNYDSH